MKDKSEPSPSYNGQSFEQMLKRQEKINQGLKSITPENCAYFSGSIVRNTSVDGIHVVYIKDLQVSLQWALYISNPEIFSIPVLEEVDNLTIYPEVEGQLYSIQLASTQFFVTKSGHLCCSTQKVRSEHQGEGITSQILLPERDIWVLLDGGNPYEFLNNLSLLSTRYFSYDRVRDAIDARNTAIGLVPPPEILVVLDNDWGRLNSIPPKEAFAPAQIGTFGVTHNSQIMTLLMRGLSLPSTWETNREEGFKYLETLKGVLKYQPKELEPWLRDTIETAIELLETRFKLIKSDLLSDTIEILFHHWKAYPYPKQRDKVTITPAQICEYRGIKPTGDNLKNAWQTLRDARAIFLSGGGVETSLFEMSTARAAQLNLFGSDAPPEADTIFVYSPGFWLAEAIDNDPAYLAPCLQAMWKLNPKQHSVAKRLARYLKSEWRKNTEAYLRDGKPANRFRSWANILNDSGISLEEWDTKKNPQRVVNAVNDALETLLSKDFIECADVHIYEKPNEFAALSRKGYLDSWLAQRVYIAPSDQMARKFDLTNEKRIARREGQKSQRSRPGGKSKNG